MERPTNSSTVTDHRSEGRSTGGSTMTATYHDDQLGEIYPTMLNKLNCTFGVRFSRFHCCGRHCIDPIYNTHDHK